MTGASARVGGEALPALAYYGAAKATGYGPAHTELMEASR